MEEYLIISFDSTNFAMQAESVLKGREYQIHIVPTPREITLSCGLSIRASMEGLSDVLSLAEEGKIKIKKVFKVTGAGASKNIEEIRK
jgi:hypothetical protein